MRDLPAPLPPERRTVGQLIAESIRAYGERFWLAVPLGLPLAIADQLSAGNGAAVHAMVYLLGTPCFVAAYLWACRLVLGARVTRTPIVLAVVIWLPFSVAPAYFILLGVAWFAFIGLAVPAAMVEPLSFREALVRGRRLAQADFVHALASLCALVIVVGISANVLGSLLHSQSETSARIATFLSDLVLSPLLFVGAAMVYVDQEARLRTLSK